MVPVVVVQVGPGGSGGGGGGDGTPGPDPTNQPRGSSTAANASHPLYFLLDMVM